MTTQPEPSRQDATDYERSVENLDELGEMLKGQISRMLEDAGIATHAIEPRVKKRKSAARKIEASSGKYINFSDLDDLLGVRIITYLPDEVDAVAEVITREFTIDRDKSVDKRAQLDPDRFGYLSLHYIAKLPDKRSHLADNRKFASCRFEIQIRSILQHAWAEIEHDLGYKSSQAIPKEFRRRFSRLAGLLEIADSEFQAIRNGLRDYEQQVGEEIRENPQSVLLDQASIMKLIENDDTVLRIDKEIARKSNIPAVMGPVAGTKNFAADRVQTLTLLGISDIKQVTDALDRDELNIIRLATSWMSHVSNLNQPPLVRAFLPRGISLLYLTYLLALDQVNEMEHDEVVESLHRYLPKVTQYDALMLHQIYNRVIRSDS